LSEAKDAIDSQLSRTLKDPKVAIDVYAYNSKVIYLIVKSASGDRITRLPCTGRETVLYVLAGEKLMISPQSKLWILRSGKDRRDERINLNWDELVAGGDDAQENQLQPSDRLFVQNPASE
jgi:polysaccharide export outer membrane protein